MHKPVFLLAGLVLSAQALAADLTVKVEIPKLNVAEYHRPYVAIWLQDEAQQATNLAVQYDVNKKNNAGAKWLKDMRQWWRRSGRELQMPVDGVSGATPNVGVQRLSFSTRQGPLAGLAAGKYTLMVEAAREAGGREVLEIPLQWPPKKAQQLKAAGQHELGAVVVELKP